MKLITLEELGKHKSPDDAWVLIDNIVYDVTLFVSQHPGGNILIDYLGQDITTLFKSTHGENVKKIIDNAKQGKHPLISIKGMINTSSSWKWEGEFYKILKQRVYCYFKENKKKVSIYNKLLLINAAFLLILTIIAWWFSMYKDFYWVAIPYGFLLAQIGIQVMHTANHGGFSRNSVVNKIAMYSMDLIGLSSLLWRTESHNIHHQFTNSSKDPDVSHSPILRIRANEPYSNYYRWQHLYVFFVYMFTPLRWLIFDNIIIIFSKKIKKIEKVIHIIFFLNFLFFNLIFPAILHGLSYALLLFGVMIVSIAIVITLIFSVNHVNDLVEWTSNDQKYSWPEQQVRTTANWRSGSVFWNYFSGGLNHQIEHHLFPALNHLVYVDISSIVKETCCEFNIPYYSSRTYINLLKSNVKLLKKRGRKK